MPPSLSSSTRQHGFTLAEMLVSISIFLIISSAMFGILMSATGIFRDGEFAKTANDTSQIVCNLLEQDIAQALPATAGGVFYAKLENNNSGNCTVGWLIRNPQQTTVHPDAFLFVLWGVDHSSEEILRRVVFDIPMSLHRVDMSSLNYTRSDDNRATPAQHAFDPLAPHIALEHALHSARIAKNCLHFGTWLAGTAHTINNTYIICHKPVSEQINNVSTQLWQLVTDGTLAVADEPATEPANAGDYYTNTDIITIATRDYPVTYPDAIRFTVVLGGDTTMRKQGHLASALSIDDTIIGRIAGIENMPSIAGSLLRIGNSNTDCEWIGYHDRDGAGIHINTAWAHGPCAFDSNDKATGRGVFRSVPRIHNSGEKVTIGRLFTLTRLLPQ